MAKISARGARKLSEQTFIVRRGNEHYYDTVEYVYVLTSDRRVLRTFRYPTAPTSYDRKRAGYKLVARIKPEADDPMAIFGKYVRRERAKFGA